MRTLLAAALVVLAVSALGKDTVACPSSRTIKREVVGVDAKSNFVLCIDEWRDQTGPP